MIFEFEGIISEDFLWMKKGMQIKICKEEDSIYINKRNFYSLTAFENIYGKTTSGEQLAQDWFWHIKGLAAWHTNLRSRVVQLRQNGIVSIFVSELMGGHDLSEKYLALQLKWWGFKVHNNIVNLWGIDSNILTAPKPRLKIVKNEEL